MNVDPEKNMFLKVQLLPLPKPMQDFLLYNVSLEPLDTMKKPKSLFFMRLTTFIVQTLMTEYTYCE
jgi:hypothetical protein